MKITIRHGGDYCAADYLSVLRSLESDYDTAVIVAFVQAEPGTATAVSVDFGDSLFQVDTEANVVSKVRECLRRVDMPGHQRKGL